MQQSWENMARHPRFNEMSTAIEAGLENLSKWYHKVDNTDVYFVCLGKLSAVICVHCRAHSNDLALDPNFKTAYAEKNWDDEYYEQGMVKLRDVVSTHISQ
jgi:hypothetical protein